MLTLLLAIFLSVPQYTYVPPVRIAPPDGVQGPDRWYGCASGTLGYWVDNNPKNQNSLDKVFKAHTRNVYSDNDPAERRVKPSEWVCQVVAK